VSSPSDGSERLDPTPDGELALARRLDWRFLLPDPDLTSVIVLGRPDRQLLEALARFGESDATVEGAAGTSARVVVAIQPTVSELVAAASRVEAGGVLYAELAGPRARRASGGPLVGRIRAARRAAGAAGLVDTRLIWHWPSFATATELIELDDRRVLTAALDRHGGRGLAAGLAGRGARVLATLGLLPAMAGAVSLVARRPDAVTGQSDEPAEPGEPTEPGRPRDAVPAGGRVAHASILVALAAESGGVSASDPQPGALLLTPRFRASRHVVGLVVTGRSPAPRVVVKVPRLGDDASGLAHERRALEALGAGPGRMTAGTPPLLGHGTHSGFPWLAEGALDGRQLGRRDLLADRDGIVGKVRLWTAGLPVRNAPADLDRLVFGELAALEEVIGSGGGDASMTALIGTTRAALGPLRGVRMPAVVEHRDLAPPNLLLQPDGSIGVVDWELAEPDGLPLADLAFFLGWAASAGAGSTAPTSVAMAVDAALLDDAGWARLVLAAEARRLGLDADTVERLMPAVWARALAGLARRTGARPDLVRWLVGHRYAEIWRRAGRRFGNGGLDG
jgi:hypothetical protein